MADRMKVLVTGAAGAVGQVVVKGLWNRFRIRGFDMRPMPGIDDSVVADLSDKRALERAVEGMDAIIHLAAIPSGAFPWEEILESNIVGTQNLFEAATQGGVKRIAYTSRAGLLAPYPEHTTRTVDLPPRPKSFYSVSKVFGESLGYMYAALHGMEVVCVRIGNLQGDRPEPSHPHHLGHIDCVNVYEQAITWPGVKFEIVFGVSGSKTPLYDLESGRRAIGYYPEQGFEAS